MFSFFFSKKSSLVAILFFFSIAGVCQLLNVKPAGVLKSDKNPPDILMLGNNYYGITNKYAWGNDLSKRRYKATLTLFDSGMNIIRESTVSAKSEYAGPRESFLKRVGDSIWYISFRYSDTGRVLGVFASLVHLQTLALAPPQKILEIPYKIIGRGNLFGMQDLHKLSTAFSPDSSKLIFFWYSGQTKSVAYSVTDRNLNMIRTGSADIACSEVFSINNLYLDNDGSFFISCVFVKNNTPYAFVVANNTANTTRKIDITLDGMAVHRVLVQQGRYGGEVMLYGTGAREDIFLTHGFSMRLSKADYKLSGLVIKEIPEAVIKKFDEDKYGFAKQKRYGIFPAIQFESHSLEDGTVVLLGEVLRFVIVPRSDDREVGADMQINGPVFMIVFPVNDSISFYGLHKREQTGSSNSFVAVTSGNHLLIIYKDLDGNVNAPLSETLSVSYRYDFKNILAVAAVNQSGIIRREKIQLPTYEFDIFDTEATAAFNKGLILLCMNKQKTGMSFIRTAKAFYHLAVNGL